MLSEVVFWKQMFYLMPKKCPLNYTQYNSVPGYDNSCIILTSTVELKERFHVYVVPAYEECFRESSAVTHCRPLFLSSCMYDIAS